MKKNLPLTIAIILAMTLLANAQWTYDPLNPQVVSNTTCTQNNVQQVPDGAGGTFVFWTDSRDSCSTGPINDVYGQHYNAQGVAQWEVNGRLILDYVPGIAQFSVVRSQSDGEMIIGSLVQPGDSLRFQKIDDQGAKVWADDLLVSNKDGCSPPTYTLSITGFRFFRDAAGYCVALEATYCGGSNGHRITRFNSNGTLTGPFNGEPEGNQYYTGAWGIDKTYDGTNDIYLYYTLGNGSGAHANILRIDIAGDTVWGPVDVLAGTNGLNYFYDAKSDSNGIAACYISNGSSATQDIFIRKWNADGTAAWSGATDTICAADGGQDRVYWQQDDNFYYVCWADARPGISPGYYDIYAQKIDKATGANQWAANGIEVFSQNTYIPYTECVVTANGEMIVFNEATIGSGGFSAMKINPDGTLAWGSPVVVDNAGYLPFYSDYQIIVSEPNVIVAWAETNPIGGADGIYIARVANPTVNVFDTVTACNSYVSYGDTFTVSDVYVQNIPGDTVLSLNLTVLEVSNLVSMNGNTLTALQDSATYAWIDCSTGQPIAGATAQSFTPAVSGTYSVAVTKGICEVTSDCDSVTITGIEEISDRNTFTIFPNPFHESFTIRFTGKTKPSANENDVLEIVDVLGKKVHQQLLQSNTVVNVSFLPVGIYCAKVNSKAGSYSQIIIRE